MGQGPRGGVVEGGGSSRHAATLAHWSAQVPEAGGGPFRIQNARLDGFTRAPSPELRDAAEEHGEMIASLEANAMPAAMKLQEYLAQIDG